MLCHCAADNREGRPRPVPVAKGSQPRGRMIAQLLGPLPNGPEADTQPSGDLGMSQATGSEQPSTLQPTFFNLAWERSISFGSRGDPCCSRKCLPLKMIPASRLVVRT